MKKDDVIALDPSCIEIVSAQDSWQIYKHAELGNDGEYSTTLCGYHIINEKVLYYEEAIDCPLCRKIIQLARSNRLRYRPANT